MPTQFSRLGIWTGSILGDVLSDCATILYLRAQDEMWTAQGAQEVSLQASSLL